MTQILIMSPNLSGPYFPFCQMARVTSLYNITAEVIREGLEEIRQSPAQEHLPLGAAIHPDFLQSQGPKVAAIKEGSGTGSRTRSIGEAVAEKGWAPGGPGERSGRSIN